MRSLTLCSVFLLLSTLVASSAFAATLNVVGGQLMGASGVDVGGTLYDVEFLDGACIDLYSGCDDVSDFTFQSEADATVASQALLDQVFVDGANLFYSNPSLTNGIRIGETIGRVRTPFAHVPGPTNAANGGEVLLLTALWSTAGASTSCCSVAPVHLNPDDLPLSNPGSIEKVFAVWGPNTLIVPEPSTALLMGLGLTGLSRAGRGRNRS